jgi:cytochrome c oxidase subunit 2
MAALTLAGGLLIGLVGPAPAWAGAVTPESGGSSNADQIHSLYVVVLIIGAVIFFGVAGTLVFFLVRYRGRRGRVASQIHGNTQLEIAWTAAAAVILVALAVLTFAKLHGIVTPAASGADDIAGHPGALYATVDQPEPPGDRALRITVTGRQYLWRFDYPNGAFSYEQLVVPVNTTVVLTIRSVDVAHSWWIPKLGGKADAIPGYTNRTWFKITRPGAFSGQCAELCGRNHADMVAQVRAVPATDYAAWVTRQKRLIEQAERDLPALRERLKRQGEL